MKSLLWRTLVIALVASSLVFSFGCATSIKGGSLGGSSSVLRRSAQGEYCEGPKDPSPDCKGPIFALFTGQSCDTNTIHEYYPFRSFPPGYCADGSNTSEMYVCDDYSGMLKSQVWSGRRCTGPSYTKYELADRCANNPRNHGSHVIMCSFNSTVLPPLGIQPIKTPWPYSALTVKCSNPNACPVQFPSKQYWPRSNCEGPVDEAFSYVLPNKCTWDPRDFNQQVFCHNGNLVEATYASGCDGLPLSQEVNPVNVCLNKGLASYRYTCP